MADTSDPTCNRCVALHLYPLIETLTDEQITRLVHPLIEAIVIREVHRLVNDAIHQVDGDGEVSVHIRNGRVRFIHRTHTSYVAEDTGDNKSPTQKRQGDRSP